MTPETPRIRADIVSDVVCPWCAIGYYQLATASRETGVQLEVHWHPFELNPHMAPEGENLRDHLAAKYGTTLEGSIKARARLTEMGAALGFMFNYADDMRMWNTFRAHQLIGWAEEQGRGHEMKLALFRAYFTDRRNVSSIDVLAAIAGESSMDQEAAKRVLEGQTFAEATRRREAFWSSRGVSGVPAMIFQGRHLVTGAQGVETYGRILRRLMDEKAA